MRASRAFSKSWRLNPSGTTAAASLRDARYSLSTLEAFSQYCASAAFYRVVFVILSMPLLTLLITLLAPLVPLRDPNNGLGENVGGYIPHSAIIWFTTFVGSSLHFRAGAQLAHEELPTRLILLAAAIATLLIVGVAALVTYLLRFPLPFFWVVLMPAWLLCFIGSHLLVTKGALLHSPELQRKIRRYLPAFGFQLVQIVMYPAFSAAYVAAKGWQQIALTVLFPLVKIFIKSELREFTGPLGDFAEEVAISSVETCAAACQSMILQASSSPFATAFVIGVDLAHGWASVKFLLDKQSTVQQNEIISTGLVQMQQRGSNLREDDLSRFATRRMTSIGAIKALGRRMTAIRKQPTAVGPSITDTPTDQPAGKTTIVLVHALEVVQAAESVLLVAYLEVAIAILYSVFFTVAAQWESAIYHPLLYAVHYHQERLLSALQNIVVYTGLQLVSITVIANVIRVRFRLSPWTLLAFHLERHAWSLQGKLIAWLPLLLQFAVIHYGADFRFHFQFKVPGTDD